MEILNISHSHSPTAGAGLTLTRLNFFFLISPGKKKSMMIQEEPFLDEVSYYLKQVNLDEASTKITCQAQALTSLAARNVGC